MSLIGAVTEERAENGRGAVKVGDPLKQGRNPDAAARGPTMDVVESGLPRDQDGREHIGGVFGHRDDAGLYGVFSANALNAPGCSEAAQGVVVVGRHGVANGEVVAVELAGEKFLSLVLVQFQIAAAGRLNVQAVEHGVSRRMESIGVVAHVEGGQMEAERPGAVDQRLDHLLGAGIGAVVAQAVGDVLQVIHEVPS